MSPLSIEFLKKELQETPSKGQDSFINSPLYYILTGRKGAHLYKNADSMLVTCSHPHVDNRLMVFPETGKADYRLTASVLGMIDVPENGVQLARYTMSDLENLKRQISKANNTTISNISALDENYMDWRYPIHILDTHIVSAMKGKAFIKIRNKFRKAADKIMCTELNKSNCLRMMRAALKFWEGSMIFNDKETDDLSSFYTNLFKIVEMAPECVSGLLFTSGRRPVGFSAWDTPQNDTSNLFVNLADTSVTGLSDFQVVSTARVLAEKGIKYLNMGGSEQESLDRFKAKFQPAYSLPVHSAEVVYARPENINIERIKIV